MRKTSKGCIKDGEMAFSINDNSARATACTASLEVWPTEMLNDLEDFSFAQPACLDASDTLVLTRLRKAGADGADPVFRTPQDD